MLKIIENKLIAEFKDRYNFSEEELFTFFKSFEPDLQKDEFNAKIVDLKKKNIIKTKTIGHFTISYRPQYRPEISDEIFNFAKVIAERFGTINYCIWDTNWINEFTNHNQVKKLIIIEIEQDFVELLYHELKDNSKYNYYLYPDENAIDFDTSKGQCPVVIKKIITQSPILKRLKKKININTPQIEKIVVDLGCYCAQAALTFVDAIVQKRYAFNHDKYFRYIKRAYSEKDIKRFMTNISPPMKYHWSTTKKEKTYFLEVKIQEKQVLGYETTGHYKSETGGYITFEELLNGKWDDWITNTFGEDPLIEVKNTIRYL